MKNDLYVVYNMDLDTWLKIYENKKFRYHLTLEEANEIIKEYRHDKNKCINSLLIFKLGDVIKNTYVDRNLIEEAGL